MLFSFNSYTAWCKEHMASQKEAEHCGMQGMTLLKHILSITLTVCGTTERLTNPFLICHHLSV